MPYLNKKSGFTIVELLVVIVVIGILAAITIVAYTGISSRAIISSLVSDLSNNSTQLKNFQVINGNYPTANNCPTPGATEICLKSSNGATPIYVPNNNINPQTFCLSLTSNSTKYFTSDNSSPASGSCVNSCLDILNAGGSTGDGVYSINPAGVSMQVYCDMTNDGGGWTLVLQNNSTVTTPSPAWNAAINGVTTLGTFGSDQSLFDVLVGLGFWKTIGTQMRVQVGTSPSVITHKATYNFTINPSNYYTISLSSESILLGGTEPGIFVTHNNKPFTTYDADHDTYPSGNCSASFNNHPWWYVSCWSGSFFGGGSGYQEAAYWTGSSTEYYAHGSIWIK